MKFMKSEDGETVSAIDENGNVVAYIKKNRFGTHGHWHGWDHFLFCDSLEKWIWAGVARHVAFQNRGIDNPWDKWTEAPVIFSNIKEFKLYHETVRKENQQ